MTTPPNPHPDSAHDDAMPPENLTAADGANGANSETTVTASPATEAPPTAPPVMAPVVELTGAIPLDDATCYNTPDGGVLIEPGATPARWVPFWLMLGLEVLTVLLFMASLVSLDGSVLGVFGWLVRNLALGGMVAALALVLYPQWLALRRPVFSIIPDDELIEVEWAHRIRRIPFPVITLLRIAADPVQSPLDRVLNIIFERLNVQRRGIGFVLKHGEVVWCGVLSGEDARDRARRIRQRISQSISGSNTSGDA